MDNDLIIIISITILSMLCAFGLNYLADVLPIYRTPGQPVCRDRKPLVGWGRFLVFLPSLGSCQKYLLRKILVNISFPLLMVILWLYPPAQISFLLAWLLTAYFYLVAIIDIEHRVILYQMTVMGALLGIGVGFSTLGPLLSTLGALVGMLIMLVIYFFGVLFAHLLKGKMKSPQDNPAIGFGDVTLTCVLGSMVGWPEITGVIFAAILSAGLFSAGLIMVNLVRKQYQAFSTIPYAPFLLAGTALFLFIL